MAKKFRSLLTANACAVLLGTLTPVTAQDDITCIVFMGDDLQPIAQGQSL